MSPVALCDGRSGAPAPVFLAEQHPGSVFTCAGHRGGGSPERSAQRSALGAAARSALFRGAVRALARARPGRAAGAGARPCTTDRVDRSGVAPAGTARAARDWADVLAAGALRGRLPDTR